MPFVNFSDSIQYIIGIDFGNGETSAAFCELSNANTPEDLTFHNRSTIETAISVDTNDAVRLGFDVLNVYAPQQCGAYLKGKPSELDNDPRRKELYIRFVKEIYKEIMLAMVKISKELTPRNHLVFVACPSMSEEWNEDEKRKYAMFMAEECGLPILKHNVFGIEEYGVFRESRAAYVKYKGSNTAKNSDENILVIDFGSSTVDMTYHPKTDKPIDKSYSSIGAQNVEERIMKWSMSAESQEIDDKERELLKELYDDKDNKGWKELIKLKSRKSKQEYYSSSNPRNVELQIRPRDITGNPALPKTIDVEVTRDILEEVILADYKKDIKSCFEDFKSGYLKNNKLSAIVITGGASRMAFVDDGDRNGIIAESFPSVKRYHPMKDNATSLLVSNGIAMAGRVEIKMIQMLQQLNSEISNIKIDGTFEIDEKEKLIYKDAEPSAEEDINMKLTFVNYLTQCVVDKVIAIQDEVFAEVAAPDSPYNTINKIRRRMEAKLGNLSNWASTIISSTVGTCVEKYYNDYKERLNTLLKSYFPGVNAASHYADPFSTKVALNSKDLINGIDLQDLSFTMSVLAVNVALTILAGVLVVLLNVGVLIDNVCIGVWNFFASEARQVEKLEYIDLDTAVTQYGLEPDDKLSERRRKKMLESYEEKKRFLRADLQVKIKKVLEDKIDIDTIAKHIKMQVDDYVVNAVKDVRHLLR